MGNSLVPSGPRFDPWPPAESRSYARNGMIRLPEQVEFEAGGPTVNIKGALVESKRRDRRGRKDSRNWAPR
jgi:hypothetical protein